MMLTISYDTMNYRARYAGFQQSEFRKYRLGSAVNSESCLCRCAPNYNESMTISSKLSLTQVANYVNISHDIDELSSPTDGEFDQIPILSDAEFQ